MMDLSRTLKTAVLAVSLIGLSAAAGCAPAYCDGYDCRGRGYYNYHYDSDSDPYRNNSYYYRQRDYGERHWVCDADGDDCHWSYER